MFFFVRALVGALDILQVVDLSVRFTRFFSFLSCEQSAMYLARSTAVAHVARWGPYNLRDLRIAHVPWVGYVYCTDPAQPLTTAGEEPDDLDDLH